MCGYVGKWVHGYVIWYVSGYVGGWVFWYASWYVGEWVYEHALSTLDLQYLENTQVLPGL